MFTLTPMFLFHETWWPPLIHRHAPVDCYNRYREETTVSRIENACPFDAATRAARCTSCSVANASIPPCVVAFLGGNPSRDSSNVVPLRRADQAELRRAA